MRSNLEDIEVVVRRETEKAWGVVDPGGPALIWLPKSECEISDHDERSGRATLTAPDWLLVAKGLV